MIITISTLIWMILIIITYSHSKWNNIISCYLKFFNREYWTNYNTIEAVSYLTKILIIVPGLVFGIQIWWFYFFTLATSLTLIWASNKKLLPTLVAFNTIWVWLSCAVIVKHFYYMIN